MRVVSKVTFGVYETLCSKKPGPNRILVCDTIACTQTIFTTAWES